MEQLKHLLRTDQIDDEFYWTGINRIFLALLAVVMLGTGTTRTAKPIDLPASSQHTIGYLGMLTANIKNDLITR